MLAALFPKALALSGSSPVDRRWALPLHRTMSLGGTAHITLLAAALIQTPEGKIHLRRKGRQQKQMRCILHRKKFEWYGWGVSNLRPQVPQTCALTN